MADQQWLDLLQQGVDTWNRWKTAYPDIHPDLSGADLSKAHFIKANLSDTNLSGADLSDANLFGANLSDANLYETDLSGAIAGKTNFGNVNLRTVKGLETVDHWGPSTIGADT